LDLAHALDAQRLPREILAGAPAALRAGHALRRVGRVRPLLPGVRRECALPQRLELLRELAPRGHRERGRDADVLERSPVVVQAQQQRADDAFPFLVPAKARDDAVGGARVLDLHHRALAGLVGPALWLRDHAVEPRAFEATEPLAGERAIARGG